MSRPQDERLVRAIGAAPIWARATDSAPTSAVAIWCNTWLGLSETFIANQAGHLQRNSALLCGLFTDPDPLVKPDYAPYKSGYWSRFVAGQICRGRVPRGYLSRLRAESVSLVHAHYGPDAVVASGIARRVGVPLVSTFHGYDATSMARNNPEYRGQLEQLFRDATIIIAVSQFIADHLVQLGAPEHKIRVHYIGIPIKASVAAPSSTRRQGIVFVGRLVEKKGVDQLLAAVAQLPVGLRDTSLVVIGSGSLEARLRHQAQVDGLNVCFLGQQSAAEVAAHLRSASVFCAPSRTAANGDAEGLGMVFLEAGLAGLPVVAYQHGGVTEAVIDRHTGLLVPENDVTALSRALQALLEDPDTAIRLGKAGRERVLRDFDIRTTTSRLEDIYDEARALYNEAR